MRTRSATIVATSVEVLCPHCGEAQPNPDNGADNWTLAEVVSQAGKRRTCVACDAEFTIIPASKVQVMP